jgi:hypothetical protein
MSATKSPILASINLQNGMFCHLVGEFLIVSGNHNPEIINFEYDLSKTKNQKKARIILNIVFTLIFASAAVYTQFYPLILLLFLSLWDLRQLNRYKLPINKTKIIPLKNVTEIRLKKGQLGFNYMDVYLENNGDKSFIPLQLYDSESTLENAKVVTSKIGKLTESPEIEKIEIVGYSIPLNEVSSYVLKDDVLHYTQNNLFNRSRIDSYKYLRLVAYFALIMILVSIGIKINIINTTHTNYIDNVVIVIFILAMLIPIKYVRKALPNTINVTDIIEFKQGNNKSSLILKQKIGFNLKVHLKSKFLPKDIREHLNTSGK